MPLDDLISVIETLKERIRTHGATLRARETRTRMSLIDPLLTALGWDVSDPGLVTPEYSVSGLWPDYALRRPSGQPVAIIEAKKLGESLQSYRMDLSEYADKSGVFYAGLTDGNHWQLYGLFDQELILLLRVSIVDMPAQQCARRLLLLRPRILAPAPAVMPPPSGEGWIPLSSYQRGPVPPIAIHYPDGAERQVQSYLDLATHTVAWLWSTKRLTRHNVPMESRPKHYIVNFDPVHQTKESFTEPIEVAGTPLHYEGYVPRRPQMNDARDLLKRCYVNLDDVYVQERQDPK